jgi:predicted nucleic acid-binding protein
VDSRAVNLASDDSIPPWLYRIPEMLEMLALLLGAELFSARPDKGYSLIDCISMQTMYREGLTDVLTNDRHFEQEGFRALFRA